MPADGGAAVCIPMCLRSERAPARETGRGSPLLIDTCSLLFGPRIGWVSRASHREATARLAECIPVAMPAS